MLHLMNRESPLACCSLLLSSDKCVFSIPCWLELEPSQVWSHGRITFEGRIWEEQIKDYKV